MKNIENDKKAANLRVLRPMRIRGLPYAKGDVVSKTGFDSSGDWMDLCAMNEPWLEQTSDPVSRSGDKPKAGRGKSAVPVAPGAAD